MNFHEPQIDERGTNMKRTHWGAALLGLVAVGVFAADASAFYNPRLGRWLQRDPGSDSRNSRGFYGSAPVAQFIPRDEHVDGMNLYQYARSNPIGSLDPKGTDRWKEGGLHDEIVYTLYTKDGCRYRRCGFFAKGWNSDSVLDNIGAVVGATIWEVEGLVICINTEKPKRDPDFYTSKKADEYLDALMTAMEKAPPKYRTGHNCRVWVNALTEYGNDKDKFEGWAAYDHKMAETYEAWAKYDESTGNRNQANYNRERAKAFREEAEYNAEQAKDVGIREAEAAYGAHPPFIAY